MVTNNMEIKLQIGVKILLKNKDNEYLLVHRSAEKYPDIKGRWDIVGGRINPGSTLLENLKREIKEETGLDLVGAPELIGAQDILKSSDLHIVRLTYTGQANGEVTLDVSENDKYQWCNFEELEKLEDSDVYFRELLGDTSLWQEKI
ncbi:MAG: NUDIX hydrolase [Candidatus Staskawiczbacteria bacterium]|nr:NUDIX hydrolase [Candidatus Staskawiczbacteria bacterium]